jgi:hypothetical protein
VKLDVQMSTARQIDCGCPESGGRLTSLGTVDFCPADPRILGNVNTGREVVLERAVHQDFIQLVSTISCMRPKWIGQEQCCWVYVQQISTWKGRTFELETVKRSLRLDRRNSINRPDLLQHGWIGKSRSDGHDVRRHWAY